MRWHKNENNDKYNDHKFRVDGNKICTKFYQLINKTKKIAANIVIITKMLGVWFLQNK